MSHRLQVLIPEQLDVEITKAAQRRQISKGEWVRRAIRRALDHGARSEGVARDTLGRLASLSGPTGDIETILSEIEAGRAR